MTSDRTEQVRLCGARPFWCAVCGTDRCSCASEPDGPAMAAMHGSGPAHARVESVFCLHCDWRSLYPDTGNGKAEAAAAAFAHEKMCADHPMREIERALSTAVAEKEAASQLVSELLAAVREYRDAENLVTYLRTRFRSTQMALDDLAGDTRVTSDQDFDRAVRERDRVHRLLGDAAFRFEQAGLALERTFERAGQR